MSGGSWSYVYIDIEESSVNMKSWDMELSELLVDLSKVCHDCEWADSYDYSSEEGYASIKKFKDKWFGSCREDRLRGYIDDMAESFKESAYRVIGGCS